jgi:tripartite-type tricarboxylate transporter receptor subunit TctC
VADGKANPMTIGELVNELKADNELAAAFAGSGASGSGASTTEKKAGGGSVRTIAHGDNKAFIDNLDDIAAGKTIVE